VKNPRILLIALLIVALLGAIAFLPLEQMLTDLQGWVRANERFAFLAVVLFITAGFLLLLPASVLIMLAGFLFGLWQGFAGVWIATLLASSLAFWIARSVARKWMQRKIQRKPIFIAIDRAIQRKGLPVVILTRLVMILPFPGLNYTLGLTGVRFRDYLAGTMIGMIPPLFLFVFLGTTAGNISAIMRGEVSLESDQLLIVILAAVAVVILVGLIIRMAGRVLREELKMSSESGAV
jgi:uncharacterized membrane protein YdjX (TVP38/TMEM64 family)